MNIENVKKAIAIMERAKANDSLYMPNFQSLPDNEVALFDEVSLIEVELHTCGNRACFAGNIAVSPEFQADGGAVSKVGAPVYEGDTSYLAIAKWLGISTRLAVSFVEGNGYPDSPYYERFPDMSMFYKKRWVDVTADDVIEKLKLLLSGELE